MTSKLQILNTATLDEALAMTGHLVERSPWVARAALVNRPFYSDEELAQALVEQILQAGFGSRLKLFNAHPELAGIEAVAGEMTVDSTSEQSRLGLTNLSIEEAERIRRMNAEYRTRFGYPFIIALHRVQDRATLFNTFERRLNDSPIEEHTTTLAEMASVIRSRTRREFSSENSSPLINTNTNQE